MRQYSIQASPPFVLRLSKDAGAVPCNRDAREEPTREAVSFDRLRTNGLHGSLFNLAGHLSDLHGHSA